MRLTIALILITTIFTSCGNKRNRSNGGESNSNGMTLEAANLECSYAQVRTQCLDLPSPKRIAPRFFYYRQCYVEYKSCIRGFGY